MDEVEKQQQKIEDAKASILQGSDEEDSQDIIGDVVSPPYYHASARGIRKNIALLRDIEQARLRS